MLDAIKISCNNCWIDVEATGRNIRKMRMERHITPNDLAEIFYGDATVQAISQWETGKTLPKVDKLFVLAKVFGVTIDEIIVGCVRNDPPLNAA